MPTYVYQCSRGHQMERIQSVREMEATLGITCVCGETAFLKIVPAMIAPMFTPYKCPVTGDPITSLVGHRENLKKHGCRVYEPGETDQLKREKAQSEADFDRKIDKTTDEFIDKLSGDQRAQLVNEVSAGADVSIVRKGI